jgi:hypothetical protein
MCSLFLTPFACGSPFFGFGDTTDCIRGLVSVNCSSWSLDRTSNSKEKGVDQPQFTSVNMQHCPKGRSCAGALTPRIPDCVPSFSCSGVGIKFISNPRIPARNQEHTGTWVVYPLSGCPEANIPKSWISDMITRRSTSVDGVTSEEPLPWS